MILDEINKYVALIGGLVVIVQGGIFIYEKAKKHDLLPNLINLFHFISFLSAALAFVSIFSYNAYLHAVLFFFISWVIDSYFFGTGIEKPTRYEIWMMIYQTNVLFMLIMIYFVIHILNILKNMAT